MGNVGGMIGSLLSIVPEGQVMGQQEKERRLTNGTLATRFSLAAMVVGSRYDGGGGSGHEVNE